MSIDIPHNFVKTVLVLLLILSHTNYNYIVFAGGIAWIRFGVAFRTIYIR
jgi:hypothetical protein